jgi:hypothetical protein
MQPERDVTLSSLCCMELLNPFRFYVFMAVLRNSFFGTFPLQTCATNLINFEVLKAEVIN